MIIFEVYVTSNNAELGFCGGNYVSFLVTVSQGIREQVASNDLAISSLRITSSIFELIPLFLTTEFICEL